VRRKRPDAARLDFEELVADLTADVWLLCRHLGDASVAEDLTQETFLRAYRSLPGFRGECAPRTWVFSIARRVCADHVQRARRDRRLTAMAALDRGQVTEADRSGEVALWALVDGLAPDRRAAFVLTQVFGLSYEETAAVCDCAVGTVRSRVARARADLVRDHGGHDERAVPGGG